MTKKTRFGLIAFIVIIMAAALFWKGASENEEAVKIGYLNIVASLPLFVAEEMGYFDQEGIPVETTALATSNQLVDAVVAGNLDAFIEASAVPVLAVEGQSPGKLKVFSVSEITPATPFDSLLVMENAPIHTLGNLQGKKIGVFPGSTAMNLLKKYLADSGNDISAITFVPMPPANHLIALMEGAVDAIHAYEPTTAIALSKGGTRKIFGSVYAEMLSPNPQGVAVIGAAFVENRPEAAHKVIRALEKAMDFMKKHDEETRRILMKRMNLDEDIAKRVVFLYMLPHDQIPRDTFQAYADMLTELGELSGPVKTADLLYKD